MAIGAVRDRALPPLSFRQSGACLPRRPLKFQVTPKQRQSGIYLRLVRPQLIVFGLTILGIVWSLGTVRAMGKLHDPWVHLLNGGWAIYNLVSALGSHSSGSLATESHSLETDCAASSSKSQSLDHHELMLGTLRSVANRASRAFTPMSSMVKIIQPSWHS